ncbi:MAG: hypothetical protein ACJAWS_000569 [Oleiphilaceae bacterium]|jgi:hypothetical protein
MHTGSEPLKNTFLDFLEVRNLYAAKIKNCGRLAVFKLNNL